MHNKSPVSVQAAEWVVEKGSKAFDYFLNAVCKHALAILIIGTFVVTMTAVVVSTIEKNHRAQHVVSKTVS